MNVGKKAVRINPFNEKFEHNSIPVIRQDDVNPCSENITIISSETVEEEVLIKTTTLTKSKKKRLRIKKAKLRQSETQAQVLNKPEKETPSNNLAEVVTNVNSIVTNIISKSNLCIDSTPEIIYNKANCENSLNTQKVIIDPIPRRRNNPEMKANNNPNQEKSKEDILAERQAKKLAKQNAKKKDKNVTSINLIKDNKNSEICKNETKIDNSQNSVNVINKSEDVVSKSKVATNLVKDNADKSQKTSINKPNNDRAPNNALSSQKVVMGTDEVDGEIRIRMKPPVLSDLNEGLKSEKSREEIKADREAKKLAKVTKKQQVKDVSAVTVKENIPVVPLPEQSDKKTEAQPEKSKAELKAERRAKQEAQRAAKETQKKAASTPIPVIEKKILKKSPEVKKDVVKVIEKVSEYKIHQHKLFSHLCIEPQPLGVSTVVHPAIVELGKKYGTRVVSGSNARCVSLLLALKQVITDYRVSSTSDLNRGLEAELAAIGSYLARARPLSVSMTNSLRYIRSHLTQTSDLPDDEAKKRLLESIDTFIREQVDVAGQAISNTVQEKISNGDVILTYGCSSLVWRCLKESYQAGKEFSVVVVDGGPWYEGRELLRRLAALSIPCTYLLISAVGFAITKISKVLLGAHALLANGYVMSRTGSAMIALTASAHSVPVLVCCETYKFCERVQADAFVYNELGGGEEASLKGVKWLSPIYDITPPDLVTAVVTELAILPCTSVPVVLRVKPSDIHHAT